MRITLLLLLTLLLLFSCSETAGGTDVEVGGTVAGIVSQTPEQGVVEAILVPADFHPGIDADSLKRTTPVVNGHYEFRGISDGDYHILFRNSTSEWVAFTRVKTVSSIDSITLDTIVLTHSAVLTVILSELGITNAGVLSLEGSDLFVTVSAGSDTLQLKGVPGTSFEKLLFSSSGLLDTLAEEVVIKEGSNTQIPYAKTILFINDGNSDTTQDFYIAHRFGSLFSSVTYTTMALFDETMVKGMHAVVILPSVTTLSDTLYWKMLNTPLMVCSEELWRPLGMVYDSDTAVGVRSSHSGSVEDLYHPILDSAYKAQERIKLITDVGIAGQPILGWGTPGGNGRRVVTNFNTSKECILFTYEGSSTLSDESIASHHRLGIFSLDRFDCTSEEAWWLYQRSLYWVTGILPAF